MRRKLGIIKLIEGEFDEDLFQEQCIVLINCIALFEL